MSETAEFKLGIAEGLGRAMEDLRNQIARHEGPLLVFELGRQAGSWGSQSVRYRQEAERLTMRPQSQPSMTPHEGGGADTNNLITEASPPADSPRDRQP
jgi:hypothetical protein